MTPRLVAFCLYFTLSASFANAMTCREVMAILVGHHNGQVVSLSDVAKRLLKGKKYEAWLAELEKQVHEKRKVSLTAALQKAEIIDPARAYYDRNVPADAYQILRIYAAAQALLADGPIEIDPSRMRSFASIAKSREDAWGKPDVFAIREDFYNDKNPYPDLGFSTVAGTSREEMRKYFLSDVVEAADGKWKAKLGEHVFSGKESTEWHTTYFQKDLAGGPMGTFKVYVNVPLEDMKATLSELTNAAKTSGAQALKFATGLRKDRMVVHFKDAPEAFRFAKAAATISKERKWKDEPPSLCFRVGDTAVGMGVDRKWVASEGTSYREMVATRLAEAYLAFHGQPNEQELTAQYLYGNEVDPKFWLPTDVVAKYRQELNELAN